MEEEIDDGNTGTGVNGWRGDCGGAEVRGDGDPGIVLIRFTDEADPLGRKKDVSKDASTSCSAIDWTEGEGWRIDDSYDRFVMDAHGSGPGGRIDDEVWVKDDSPPDDETVDIDSGLDNTVGCEIAYVEGGKVDAVETDERTSDDGVITDVEPRVESGRVGSKLKLTVCSSSESLSSPSSSGQDVDVVGIWKELGVLASDTSTELSNEGVADSANDVDGVGKGGSECEGGEG